MTQAAGLSMEMKAQESRDPPNDLTRRFAIVQDVEAVGSLRMVRHRDGQIRGQWMGDEAVD
jgi:hypothetical protein